VGPASWRGGEGRWFGAESGCADWFGFEGGEDLGAELGDGAGAEGEDHVAGAGVGGDGGDCGGEIRRAGDLGALDAGGEALGGDALDGLFAGSVDGQDSEGVCVPEGGGKLGHEVGGAGVTVGLEEDVDALVTALAGGGEGGANLGGVVAVIVNDGDAGGFALALEAAVHAAEVSQAFGDLFGGDGELVGDGDGGGGV